MDKVYINGLQLYTLIGVYDFERHAKQRVIVDIELHTNLQQAGRSDNVADTLDYGKIAQRLADIADNASYQLLEALGEHMAKVLLDEFAAESVNLTINKPDILDNVTAVGIKIVRSRAQAAQQ
ncbi:MAG: dihydroneopterin aldolase [Kangiellaceae bacterium]|jgi:dihydroneopterin aldolase